MYFDTIHEIPEFDAVIEPEGGYQSCWESETELQTDDDNGSFLFSKLDGDSASVICVDEDEAMELIERWKLTRQQKVPQIGDIPDNRKNENPYDNIEEQDGEHVYETIDDCIEEYQIFVCNDERSSPQETPTKTAVTHRNSKITSPTYKPKRANSLPFSQPEIPLKYTRKYSDCTEYSKHAKRHHRTPPSDRIYSSLHPPPLPPPNPITEQPEYEHLHRLPQTKSIVPENKKTSPSHQIILKHKGKEYVLPVTDNTAKPRRHSSSGASPKHSSGPGLPFSPSTASHLSSLYSTIPHSTRRQGSPPQSDVQQNKRKIKHNSAHGSVTSSQSSHVTLYGML